MDSEQSHISQYDPATTARVLGETAQVLRAIGFASYHAVLIGGVVPGMLVPDPPRGLDAHVGTNDIDLCLSIALVEGDTGEYERIETAIKRLDFAVDRDSFRWTRRGDFKVTLEFFCPTNAVRPVGMFRPRAAENPVAKQNFGSTLSAFALDAGDLMVSDVVIVPREVTLPDSGDRLVYDFRVTGLVGFLAAKSAALIMRDKDKDAYDIVWLLEAWTGGPRGAGVDVLSHQLYIGGEAKPSMQQLVSAFETVESTGPGAYSRFLTTGGMTGDDITGLRLRAHGAVGELRSSLGL